MILGSINDVLPPLRLPLLQQAKYFSPIAVWTKFPPQSNTGLLFLVGQAMKEYIQCYKTLLSEPIVHVDPDVKIARSRVLREYLDYRIANDPAKRLLTSAFGAKWTETALSQLMFPHSYMEEVL